MDGLDVSTIFGNALDNALEACAKLPEEERFLTIRAAPKHEMLVIQIENAARTEEQKNGTSKEDPFLHGFGLKNIRQAAEKYDGQCQWELKGGIFTLNILIPERGGVRDEQ